MRVTRVAIESILVTYIVYTYMYILNLLCRSSSAYIQTIVSQCIEV